MGYSTYGRSGGGYSGGSGGGYQKSSYNPPQKKELNIEEECGKYAFIYSTLKGSIEEAGIPLEEVKDYIGGWVSGIKISWDKTI